LRDSEKARGAPTIPFTISETGTLNVAGKLNSQRKSLYHLQVRVFDNGDPPLYSDANITVKVVDKSQWYLIIFIQVTSQLLKSIVLFSSTNRPPVVSTLTVTAITAEETFGAFLPLGRIRASDFDIYDVLVYSLVETPSSSHFTIDSSNGTFKSLTPLKSGTYELGVTVSDGRWTARGDAYIRIVTLASLIPEMKLDQDQIVDTNDKDGTTWVKSFIILQIKKL
jgi:hypothetical protein